MSNKTLYSTTDCANPTLLSYHIYDSEGKLVNHDGRRTILDIDIKDTYIQGLTITLPKKKDVYSVEVDFVTEGKRWWGINSKFRLHVN